MRRGRRVRPHGDPYSTRAGAHAVRPRPAPVHPPGPPPSTAHPSHPTATTSAIHAVQRRPCLIVPLTACVVEIGMIDRAVSTSIVVRSICPLLTLRPVLHLLPCEYLPCTCPSTCRLKKSTAVRPTTPLRTAPKPATAPPPPGQLHLIGIMRAVVPSASATCGGAVNYPRHVRPSDPWMHP